MHPHSPSSFPFLTFLLDRLGLLQACFAVSNFVAPFAIGQLGPRWCMMLGGCFYVLMLSSLIHVNKAFFIVASAFNGVGAALLWTSEVGGRAGGAV